MVKRDDTERERTKRNVTDVDYAETDDGYRPMREVIRERTAKARRAYTRKQLDAAYRARAREQALLLTCLCCYPLVLADTPSKHEAWCPAEHMRRSYEAADARETGTITNANHEPTTESETKGTTDGT